MDRGIRAIISIVILFTITAQLSHAELRGGRWVLYWFNSGVVVVFTKQVIKRSRATCRARFATRARAGRVALTGSATLTLRFYLRRLSRRPALAALSPVRTRTVCTQTSVIDSESLHTKLPTRTRRRSTNLVPHSDAYNI